MGKPDLIYESYVESRMPRCIIPVASFIPEGHQIYDVHTQKKRQRLSISRTLPT